MATLLGLLEEQLQCSICLGILRDPRSVICGHTFCFACISQVRKQGNRYRQCPTCRENYRISECAKSQPLAALADAFRSIATEAKLPASLAQIRPSRSSSQSQCSSSATPLSFVLVNDESSEEARNDEETALSQWCWTTEQSYRSRATTRHTIKRWAKSEQRRLKRRKREEDDEDSLENATLSGRSETSMQADITTPPPQPRLPRRRLPPSAMPPGTVFPDGCMGVSIRSSKSGYYRGSVS
jgi:hypothetical protein